MKTAIIIGLLTVADALYKLGNPEYQWPSGDAKFFGIVIMVLMMFDIMSLFKN